MAIPSYEALMRPLLLRLKDGQDHQFADLVRLVADDLGLSAQERAELLPSGKQSRFRNRLHWTNFHLRHAGLIERPRRGVLRIAPRGLQALDSGQTIDDAYLMSFPEYVAFRNSASQPPEDYAASPKDETRTPEELIEEGYALYRDTLANEVLAKTRGCSPAFFEQLVVDLLVAMGYGGSRADAGRAVGGTGDGGIDGIIKEDRLGLDAVYVQAKRWESSVGRPVVQAFAGSLEGHRARKGILITTSDFSSEARDYVSRIEKRIVLLNGKELAELMIEHGIGVAEVQTYALKRLDSDYFEEGE